MKAKQFININEEAADKIFHNFFGVGSSNFVNKSD